MGRPKGSTDTTAKTDTTPKPRKRGGKEAVRGEEHILALRANLPDPNHPELFNPDRPLTDKQKIFVREWAAGETITSAALRAGYTDSSSMPYKLARDPAILKLYNAEKLAYQESVKMTRQRVMEGLLEGIELAKITGEAGHVITGWKTVGQMCGYFEPVKRKIDINIKGDVTMKHLDRMSDADLLKLIKGEVTDVVFKEVTDGANDEDGDDN